MTKVSVAQTFSVNKCDGSLLTAKEQEKCKIDSVWSNDIVVKTNYISALKTEFLPKYRLQRRSLVLSAGIESLLVALRVKYDSVFYTKRIGLEKSMDKNQLFVQPKAYISSLLSFQLFAFYPDVYAVMLNPVHQLMRPVTSGKDVQKFQQEIDGLIKAIPASQFKELETLTSNMRKEKSLLLQGLIFEILQGAPEEEERRANDVVNYLLWST